MANENNIEDVAHLTLEHLKYIRSGIDHLQSDIGDLKFRMGQVEQTLLQHSQAMNHLTDRIDRINSRMITMERRMGLVDA